MRAYGDCRDERRGCMTRRVSRARQAEMRAARAATRKTHQRNRLMTIAAAIALVAVVGLVVVGDLLRKDSGETVRYASQAQGRVLGDVNAPVLIEAWED